DSSKVTNSLYHKESIKAWDQQVVSEHQYNLLSWSLYDFCGIHMLLMENGMAYTYADREEISFKPRDDLQDVEEEIRG
ncbi:hypothetical protein Tco_0372326, partial [Tanacetum coccineum]